MVVVVAGALLSYWRFWHRDEARSCLKAVEQETSAVAVTICQAEYERTHDPAAGVRLADAYRRTGNAKAALALSNELLVTDGRADALHILGQIATAQKRYDAAASALEEARKLHREQGLRGKVAQDALALAEVQVRRELLVEALGTLDECIREADGAHDAQTEGYCHLAAGRVLGYVGYFEEAERELGAAQSKLKRDWDMAWVLYELGNLHQLEVRDKQRSNKNGQAANEFRQALVLAQRERLTTLVLSIHLNLAYSLAEAGQPDEAEGYLKAAGELDREGTHAVDRSQLAARIAYHRGNLALASSVNERVYPSIDSEDDKMVVAVMQARIALASKDHDAAARWARRGIEIAEKQRLVQPAELRRWLLASRREPYEVLFEILAESGRVEEAVEVFDAWQGRSLLDVMARPRPDSTQRLTDTASKVRGLERWLPVVSSAPFMAVSRRAVLEPLRRIDLIAFVVVDDDVWRLTASRGKLRLEWIASLASPSNFSNDLDLLRGNATKGDVADQLGKLLLPEDVARPSTEPLYVVLDARLGLFPVAALRRGGRVLAAVRPVLLTPRLPVAAACRARADIQSATILGDAQSNLPAARDEASLVASLFKATPLLGEAATSDALFAARPGSLLHVAAHAVAPATGNAVGGILQLHDRVLSAAEIASRQLSPVLAVLSGCETAADHDPELAGSLATAFLAGGAGHVIATLRPVADQDALEVTQSFYGMDGAADPVRALAKVQAKLADTPNKAWSEFVVLGAGACLP